MIGFYITRVLMLIGLMGFQVLVLNNLDFSFYINPYIYPLFLLLLPFRTPHWLLMLIAFGMGITVDVFSNAEGMHAAATVFMAFVQPSITRLITPKNALETDERPNIRSLGLTWFLTYSGILILIHHTIYFFLEIFSFYNLFTTLSKIIISGATSLLFITLLAYLFSPEKKRS
jgi:rod shape-determining protein MreD